ncbi:hypothetical protein G4O51_09090 [Candidatus Bathyarchaeota archaeon A05DMB-2]|nr:hypothetical protein [Candidatus Bathyarchaeota archaeon A05DMB-2]
MSTFSSFKGSAWNYRVIATRPILVKDKNDRLRKAVAIDLLSSLPFAFEFSNEISAEAVEVEKQFSATFKIYTSKNVQDVDSALIEFFEVLDVDQNFENFIRAYWIYPTLIIFELTRIEPL